MLCFLSKETEFFHTCTLKVVFICSQKNRTASCLFNVVICFLDIQDITVEDILLSKLLSFVSLSNLS